VSGETAPTTFARIDAALALPSRAATIHDVKRAVIDEFERVDRRVRIRSTEYFRHTYVPDLVLSWQDDIDRPERWVFLRSKVRPSYLLEDVALVARDQPIIFGLAPTGGPEDAITSTENDIVPSDDAERLRDRSSATGTLITDPAGLDALSAPVGDEPTAIPELVSRQIIRGGRGVYDQQSSADTTTVINAGFAAAFTTSPEATFRAAESIREHLGENSGGRLLRLLHAIWVGSGGRSDQFPDAPTVSGALSDDALELLIAGPDIDDPDFWKRIGDVSLSQVSRLQVGDRPKNLGRLIAVHADSIEGRWCRVRPDTPRTGSDGALQWGIEQGALALHGSTFSAYLAEEKGGLADIDPVTQVGTDVDELAVRALRAEADISDVTAAGGGLIIGVASDTHGNVLDNPHTSGSVGAASGNITRATATLKNRRTVVCDFPTTTASSRTNGTLSLRELVRHGLPLVWPLHEDDMVALADMLSPVATLSGSPGSTQPSLFDDIEMADDDASTAPDADDRRGIPGDPSVPGSDI
jgi:hypothetical protein